MYFKGEIMKKLLFTAVLLCLVSAAIWAQPKFQHHKGEGFSAFSKLNLTTEQLSKINDFKTDMKTQSIDIRASIQKNNIILKNEWTQKSPDNERIKKLVTENNKLKGELALLNVDTRMKILSVLTDNQKDELQKMKYQHFDGMKHHDKFNRKAQRHFEDNK